MAGQVQQPTKHLQTPDITPAQIAASLKFLIAVGLALGLHINRTDQATIIASAGLLCGLIVIADALIRRGRAGAVAALAQPGLSQDSLDSLLATLTSSGHTDALTRVEDAVKRTEAAVSSTEAHVQKVVSSIGAPTTTAEADPPPPAEPAPSALADLPTHTPASMTLPS